MSTATIEQIENSIKEAKAIVEFGNSLERLRTNSDFKKVFLTGYFEKEAVRLVHLKADPRMQSPDSQKSILSQIDAIGSVSQFMTTALQMAHLASKQIESDEATRDEMLAEELNHG